MSHLAKHKPIGLRRLFEQIEQWHSEAMRADHQKTLEIKLFGAGDGTVPQIDVKAGDTYKGRVENDVR